MNLITSTEDAAESKGMKREILIGSLVSAMGIVLLVLALSLYMWRRKKKNHKIIREEGERPRYI